MQKYFLIIAILTGFCAEAQIGFGQRSSTRDQGGLSINYSSPKEYEIANIQVQGVQFLDNNALISLSGLRVGDKIKIPGDEISTAIKKLWKQGIIGSVNILADKIEGNKVWLVIELTERPRMTSYTFEGISKSQVTELKDKIDLVRGKMVTDVLLKNTELAVKRHLESKGYLGAEVQIRQETDTVLANSVNLRIIVDKNQKMKIKDITFIGEEHFPETRLRSKLKKTGELPRLRLPKDLLVKTFNLLKPANFVYFLTHKEERSFTDLKEYLGNEVNLNVFKSSKFVKSDFEADKTNLISFYNSRGYRDAEIVSDSVYSINRKYLNIDITVDPGRKYYFGDITWEGNYLYADDQLDMVLGIDKGDVYDLDLINKKLNFNPTGADISSLYMDDGYLFFRVTPVETRVIGDSIDVEMRIFEGAQATIDKVIISGNEKTNEHVIRRELRTLPGDKFNRTLLIRTQRELAQLGYFDPEQVNPVPKPNMMNETVDIEWQLVERPNDQIELSGGWGGFYGFVGTLGLSFNNFSVRNIPHFDKWRPLPMGDGQKLSLRVQANGRQYQSYSMSFNEPWLGGRNPNNFGVNFVHSASTSYSANFKEVYGKLTVTGGGLSLGRRVKWPDDYFMISNSLSYQKYSVFGQSFASRYGFIGDSHSLTFNTTISRNSVDNPMYPRSGSSLSISASFTPPYSLWSNKDYDGADNAQRYKFLEYHKWNLDFRYHLKLLEKLVLAPRVHFGFLGSYSDKVGVGPFERFQLGGSGLTGQGNFVLGTDIIGLRGYEDNTITPQRGADGITGGTVFTKFVMEMRYPVSLNPSATIYVLSFFEGGNNWDNFSEFNPYNLYRSAGLGVRIFMPAFGLLGLDWGYGLDPAPGSLQVSGPQFHFSIGQQIR